MNESKLKTHASKMNKKYYQKKQGFFEKENMNDVNYLRDELSESKSVIKKLKDDYEPICHFGKSCAVDRYTKKCIWNELTVCHWNERT